MTRSHTLKKQLAFSLIIVGMSIFLALALGEIYVRARYDFVTPDTLRQRSLQYTGSIFSRTVFPLEEQVVYSKDDSHVKWFINERGYRGKNFAVPKPSGTTRVIFYGGSAVFNSKIPEGKKDWPHRVEESLKKSGYSKVEVINAGIPGHASFDSLGRLFAEGHHFEPDYVVLYNAWNDIKYFKSGEPLLRRFRPYRAPRGPHLNYQGPVDRFLCAHSQLYVYLRYRYLRWKDRVGAEGKKPSGEYGAQISPHALKQFRLNIEMFVDLARNIDAVPVLMTQARLVKPGNTESEKARIKYHYQLLTHEALCEAFDATDQIIRSVAQEERVPLIDAAKSLTGEARYFVDQVHLTDEGASALASLTSEHVARLLEEKEPGDG